jgi:hypothetical protein
VKDRTKEACALVTCNFCCEDCGCWECDDVYANDKHPALESDEVEDE